MQHSTYSPLPIEAYYTPCQTDSIQTCSLIERGDAVWNLMWLSCPTVDKLPGSGNNWYKHHVADVAMCAALVADVNAYDTLFEKLSEPPAKFAAWFAKEDHKGWSCYKAGGGDKWVATVTERANEAAMRMASAIRVDGNVIQVKFGK